MNVTIIGSGYVGLVTGATLAWFGNDVCFLDVDQKKIDMLKSGKSPIYEPGLTELLQAGSSCLTYTTRGSEALQDADVIFITVGTPFKGDGSPDMTYVHESAREIGQYLNGNISS